MNTYFVYENGINLRIMMRIILGFKQDFVAKIKFGIKLGILLEIMLI